jgi:hypothetical protein
MSERIYDGPINENAILAWAYDEDLLFLDQDEDLLIGAHHEFFPLLARLSKDVSCPKADYCLTIMDYSLMFWILRKHPGAAEEIRNVLIHLLDSDRPLITNFVRVNNMRLDLLKGAPVPTLQRALEVGEAALNGICRKADISVVDDGEAWIIELSVPPIHRHKEWLSLSKVDGAYSFRR